MACNTKNQIAQSLKRLLKEKPLEKITISDIAEDCKISRMTFYYHFQDIYDLIRWMCMDEGSRAVGDCTGYDTWEDGFQALCESVLENREFVESVYHSVQHEDIEEYLYRVVFRLAMDIIEKRAEGFSVSRREKQRLGDFYAFAFVGTALKWVKTGMEETPAELTNELKAIVDGQITLALENFSGAKNLQ